MFCQIFVVFSLISSLATISVEAISCYEETLFGPAATLPSDAAVKTGCKACTVSKFTVAMPASPFVRTVWACDKGTPKQPCPPSNNCNNDNNYGSTNDDQCVEMWRGFESDGKPQMSCKCCSDCCNSDLHCGINIMDKIESKKLSENQNSNDDCETTTPAPVVQLDAVAERKCLQGLHELSEICDALSDCNQNSQTRC